MAVQTKFDALGASSYIAIFVGEAVVFLSHLIWLGRSRNVGPEATSAASTPDGSATESTESVVVEEIHVLTKDVKLGQSPV